MNKNKLAICIATLAVLFCLLLILIRQKLRPDRLSPGESLWRVSYQIVVSPMKRGQRFGIALPYETKNVRVLGKALYHPDFVADTIRLKEMKQRELLCIGRKDSPRTVISCQIDLLTTSLRKSKRTVSTLTADKREKCLHLEEQVLSLSKNVLKKIAKSPIERHRLPDSVFTFCSEGLRDSSNPIYDDVQKVLTDNTATPLGRTMAFIALCRCSNIPARLVTGFILNSTSHANALHWAEVRQQNQWIPFDPARGHARSLPKTYLPIRRGQSPIVSVIEGSEPSVNFSIERLRATPGMGFSSGSNWFDLLDLTLLPHGMQEVLALMLLLPLGALITAIFRNIVGLQTFGTFTPSLIGLSFVYAEWQTGLVVLAIVLFIGVTSRRLLEQLQLTMVPRLGIVMTLSVLTMAHLVALLDNLETTPSARVVLLPVVILTMLIERFFVCMEEDGLGTALDRVRNTLTVAFFCWLVLRWNSLGRLLVAYPEILIIVGGLLTLIGRYVGYRLSELIRFKDLVGGEK